MLAEVVYDLAVTRLSVGDRDRAQEALERAPRLNPKLRQQAEEDRISQRLR